jgi:hypothetical protein
MGSRAGVIVTTTSAPRTTSSTLVDGLISKFLYLGCCVWTKWSSVDWLRLQIRTSSQGNTSFSVASAPSAMLPAPTIASLREFLRAIHFADTAAAEPVRITVW